MHRTAIIALLLAATLGGTAVVSEASHFGASRSKVSVRVKSCSLAERTAVFHARMKRVRGARRMGMRFTLLERRGGARRFRRVKAPGLTRWRKSKRGVRSFGYRQRVEELVEGSAYKVVVRYRWYDKDGRRLRSARRTSRACKQFESLPNLRVRLLEARPTTFPEVWRYDVLVSNRGAAPAFHVPVQLTVDAAAVNTQEVTRLGRQEGRVLRFRGPACENRFSVLADPNDDIRESDETDNEQSSLCATLR